MPLPAPLEKFTLSAELARTLPPRVLTIVQQHVGAAQAITARTIATELGMKGLNADRIIRLAINLLRKDGHDIVSTVKSPPGFFMGSCQAESDAYLQFIYQKIMGHWDIYHTYARIARRKYTGAQLPLPIVEDDPKAIRLETARAALPAPRTQVVLLPDDAHPVAKFWAFVRGNGVQSQIATNILRLHDNDHEAALAELIAAKEQTLEPAG